MGCLNNSKNKKNINEYRKIYIDLKSENKIEQPEVFCGNKIKTTRFTM